MPFGPSELILNADKSIYHLNLFSKDIADTIITVGDPDRVAQVSAHFDSIELKKGKREFITHSGIKNGKRLTVISTGIGTDNIDIVLNELDALANINLETRTLNPKLKKLNIIRVGTSGAIQPDIPLDSFLISEYALGLDALLSNYESTTIRNSAFEQAFLNQVNWSTQKPTPYAVQCDEKLLNKFASNRIRLGSTITASGFYVPQFREIRLKTDTINLLQEIMQFSFENRQLTNLEMETSGIYGLSKLLGHRAISLNAILANRATGEFSKQPNKTIASLIELTIETITK
ncbi:nucleoside phosphorylase [Aurantibacter crassamenti]|uniref:nucleoside phosphorylase n=1 Tax=Aurantibacter crassamenti TaxID=1837375 RepID=UPI0019395455|nr:nucleoside phosphorylase [Aurantibacter crassamenti]MBM1107218.1 nucleoside phosphorylase [Aurantibacter crassamenti]